MPVVRSASTLTLHDVKVGDEGMFRIDGVPFRAKQNLDDSTELITLHAGQKSKENSTDVRVAM